MSRQNRLNLADNGRGEVVLVGYIRSPQRRYLRKDKVGGGSGRAGLKGLRP